MPVGEGDPVQRTGVVESLMHDPLIIADRPDHAADRGAAEAARNSSGLPRREFSYGGSGLRRDGLVADCRPDDIDRRSEPFHQAERGPPTDARKGDLRPDLHVVERHWVRLRPRFPSAEGGKGNEEQDGPAREPDREQQA